MAVILDISASVHESTIKEFLKACDRYRDKLGNTQAVAMRRGIINLIKSFRHQTPKAKKLAPVSHIHRTSPADGVAYITPKGHKQKPMPRWVVVRRGGPDKRVYIKPYKPKNGDAPVTTRGEARRKWGQYTRWGLAKKSWGWFMHALFNRANPEHANPKAKVDGRMTEGFLREIVTGGKPRVECLIVNKLDYIRDILPSYAIEGAMLKAIKSITAQIDEGHAKARKELT